MIVVRGCRSDVEAGDAAVSIGRTGKANRTVCLVPSMGSWNALVVFHGELSERAIRNIKRTRERHGQTCEIENRRFAGDSLLEWLPTDRETPARRKPCRIETGHDGPPPEREYAYSDGKALGPNDPRLDDIPAERDLPNDPEVVKFADEPTDSPERRRHKLDKRNAIYARHWLKTVELHRGSLRELAAARRNGQRGNVHACIAAGFYFGPSAMLVDLAVALDARSDRGVGGCGVGPRC